MILLPRPVSFCLDSTPLTTPLLLLGFYPPYYSFSISFSDSPFPSPPSPTKTPLFASPLPKVVFDCRGWGGAAAQRRGKRGGEARDAVSPPHPLKSRCSVTCQLLVSHQTVWRRTFPVCNGDRCRWSHNNVPLVDQRISEKRYPRWMSVRRDRAALVPNSVVVAMSCASRSSGPPPRLFLSLHSSPADCRASLDWPRLAPGSSKQPLTAIVPNGSLLDTATSNGK